MAVSAKTMKQSRKSYSLFTFHVVKKNFTRFLSVLPCHVPLKVVSLFAGIVALIAGVGTFSSVSALVYFKMTRHSARIVALITFEWFLSRMGPDVILKMRSQFA